MGTTNTFLIQEKNVFEQALERIEYLFNTYDEVIVGCSGGKDSTVCLELTIMVARKLNKLPIKVFWLDQEVEWQATEDYMSWVMHRKEVIPYWYQFEFDFTNSASAKHNFLKIWDESKSNEWIRPKSDISIKVNPTKYNRFHDIMDGLNHCLMKKDTRMCAFISGIRAEENVRRAYLQSGCKMGFITSNKNEEKRRFVRAFPIINWTSIDVWTAIAKNNWKYNEIYDKQYQYGYSSRGMRVSSLIHETSWRCLYKVQELEPKTYEKIVKRVHGVSTISHMNDIGVETIPKTLPYMFKDWKEYRDYLLIHLVQPKYWELFKHRWEGQDDEKWYKTHCKEVVINDIDGTINLNVKATNNLKARREKNINDRKSANK